MTRSGIGNGYCNLSIYRESPLARWQGLAVPPCEQRGIMHIGGCETDCAVERMEYTWVHWLASQGLQASVHLFSILASEVSHELIAQTPEVARQGWPHPWDALEFLQMRASALWQSPAVHSSLPFMTTDCCQSPRPPDYKEGANDLPRLGSCAPHAVGVDLPLALRQLRLPYAAREHRQQLDCDVRLISEQRPHRYEIYPSTGPGLATLLVIRRSHRLLLKSNSYAIMASGRVPPYWHEKLSATRLRHIAAECHTSIAVSVRVPHSAHEP